MSNTTIINHKKGVFKLNHRIEHTPDTKTYHLIVDYTDTIKAMYSFYSKDECQEGLKKLKDFYESEIVIIGECHE